MIVAGVSGSVLLGSEATWVAAESVHKAEASSACKRRASAISNGTFIRRNTSSRNRPPRVFEWSSPTGEFEEEDAVLATVTVCQKQTFRFHLAKIKDFTKTAGLWPSTADDKDYGLGISFEGLPDDVKGVVHIYLNTKHHMKKTFSL